MIINEIKAKTVELKFKGCKIAIEAIKPGKNGSYLDADAQCRFLQGGFLENIMPSVDLTKFQPSALNNEGDIIDIRRLDSKQIIDGVLTKDFIIDGFHIVNANAYEVSQFYENLSKEFYSSAKVTDLQGLELISAPFVPQGY